MPGTAVTLEHACETQSISGYMIGKVRRFHAYFSVRQAYSTRMLGHELGPTHTPNLQGL